MGRIRVSGCAFGWLKVVGVVVVVEMMEVVESGGTVLLPQIPCHKFLWQSSQQMPILILSAPRINYYASALHFI